MSQRSVLITGCSDGGLGAALALQFHKRGYRVLATARNTAKMASLKSAGIEILPLDVLSEDSIKDCVADVSKLLGGQLDMLVNNAGGGYNMPVVDIELKQMRDLFELNVFSLVSVSRAFLPLLRASKGVIVNNTSVVAVLGPPMQAAYNASKAAAAMLTHNLRQELAVFDVQVVELKTGAVRSNFFANVDTATLPAQSIYSPAKTEIETLMRGEEVMKDAITADVWASRVVGDLTRPKPSTIIWRGTSASLARLLSIFPKAWYDGIMMKAMGLGKFVQQMRAADGFKRA